MTTPGATYSLGLSSTDAYGGDLDIYGGTGNVSIIGNTGTETISQTVAGYRVFEVYNTGDLTLDGLPSPAVTPTI